MKKRTKKRPTEVWLTFHAGNVIRAIDVALKTETNAVSRYHLMHSRRYMTEFEQRHPNGVIPRLMNRNELRITSNVLIILKHFGINPPIELTFYN